METDDSSRRFIRLEKKAIVFQNNRSLCYSYGGILGSMDSLISLLNAIFTNAIEISGYIETSIDRLILIFLGDEIECLTYFVELFGKNMLNIDFTVCVAT